MEEVRREIEQGNMRQLHLTVLALIHECSTYETQILEFSQNAG